MEDKLIDFIVFPTQELIRSGPDGQLSFHEQNLGDHGELWVLKIKDGVEISRFNARYIETIVWAEPSGQGLARVGKQP